MKHLTTPFLRSLGALAGLTFDPIIITSLIFGRRSVCFWAIVLFTRDINVSMFRLTVSIYLEMLFLTRTFSPLQTCHTLMIYHLFRSHLYFQLTTLWMLHMPCPCLLTMVQVSDTGVVLTFSLQDQLLTLIMACMALHRAACSHAQQDFHLHSAPPRAAGQPSLAPPWAPVLSRQERHRPRCSRQRLAHAPSHPRPLAWRVRPCCSRQRQAPAPSHRQAPTPSRP
jgi:hypothetical protein